MPGKRKRNRRLSSSSSSSGEAPAANATTTTRKRGGGKKNLFQSPSRSMRRRQARRNRTRSRNNSEDDTAKQENTEDDISTSGSNSTDSSSSEETPLGGKSVFAGFWTDNEEDQESEEEEDTVKKGRGGRKRGAKNNKKKTTKKKNKKKEKIVEYEGFYLTIGDFVYSIGVGDVVAMRNSESFPGSNNDNDDETSTVKKERSEDPLSNPPESPGKSKPPEQEQAPQDQQPPPRDVDMPPPPDVPSDMPPPRDVPPASEYTLDAMQDEAADYYKSVPDGPVPGTIAAEDGKVTSAQPRIVSEIVTDAAPTTSSGNNAGETAPAPQTAPLRKTGDNLMLARVERVWTDRSRGGSGRSSKKSDPPIVLFQARWFLQHRDVTSLPLQELRGPTKGEIVAETVTPDDLVLSNQSDENYVTTICDIVQVLYRNPALEEPMPPSILPSTYQCRYSLVINDKDPQVVVLPYTGENDPWEEMSPSYLESRKRTVQAHENRHKDDDEEEEDFAKKKRPRVGDYATPTKKPQGIDETPDGINEGTTEQRDIQVGKRYQVPVPPFVPNQKQYVRSRNPTQLWNPHKISQEVTDEYMKRVAKILSPYLRAQQLTMEEPYQSFPTQRMEELSAALETKRLPTLSSISSGVSLSTKPVDALREFDMDAILRNLHVCNYDIEAAIRAIEVSPESYLVAWNRFEKLRFNTGFRRYSGSLRAIFKGLGGDKKLSEVIDYHYRFKIPDQFRRIQERKREQAIRMLECLESRRNLNAPIVISDLPTLEPVAAPRKGGAGRKKQTAAADSEPTKMPTKDTGPEWTKTSTSSFIVSVEERRVRAKKLLLDVEDKLGRNKMLKVFEVFKNASDNEDAVAECKTRILEICRGHRDFQKRFLEFLPQPMRL